MYLQVTDGPRQSSPNDKKKHVDALIWNKTEELLKVAEADVLEIFDWYYSSFPSSFTAKASD